MNSSYALARLFRRVRHHYYLRCSIDTEPNMIVNHSVSYDHEERVKKDEEYMEWK